MSGHSKWSTIKRKKAITDAKRGAHFTKLIREITVAARTGGGDPDMNARLRLAIDAAKAGNMPADNVERAIKKGTGELEGVHYEEITYEGYGPGGVALFIEAMTDNNNRTVAAVRHTLEKHGGNLGSSGSVAWQFERKGQITVDATRFDEDLVLEAALAAGAEDVSRQGDEFLITTQPADLHGVQQALLKQRLELSTAELVMVAKTSVEVGAKDAERLLKLLDALDDQDDVQKVHSNANIDETVMAEAAAGL
jgi:YebC/PmpR family DNA-binding regulatory protein